jgi:hypothetical protein
LTVSIATKVEVRSTYGSAEMRLPRLQARVLPARTEMVTTLIPQIVRFARPNIQIYDAHVVDLSEWVCARYLVGVKVQIQKQSAI